jgi:hypothetical protein
MRAAMAAEDVMNVPRGAELDGTAMAASLIVLLHRENIETRRFETSRERPDY